MKITKRYIEPEPIEREVEVVFRMKESEAKRLVWLAARGMAMTCLHQYSKAHPEFGEYEATRMYYTLKNAIGGCERCDHV